MKNQLTTFALIFQIICTPTISKASQIEDFMKIFVPEYLKVTARSEVINFINRNPGILLSNNPQIGSELFSKLNTILSGYQFVVAETDRERIWAGLNLLVSPEPITAVILISAQIIDGLIEQDYQRMVIEYKNEIGKIELASQEHIKAMFMYEAMRVVELFVTTELKLTELDNYFNEISFSPAFLTLLNGRNKQVKHELSELGLETLIEKHFKMENLLLDLELLSLIIKDYLNFDGENQLDPKDREILETKKREFNKYLSQVLKDHSEKLRHVNKIIKDGFLIFGLESDLEESRKNRSETKRNLKIYLHCAKKWNQHITERSTQESDIKESLILEGCNMFYDSKDVENEQ